MAKSQKRIRHAEAALTLGFGHWFLGFDWDLGPWSLEFYQLTTKECPCPHPPPDQSYTPSCGDLPGFVFIGGGSIGGSFSSSPVPLLHAPPRSRPHGTPGILEAASRGLFQGLDWPCCPSAVLSFSSSVLFLISRPYRWVQSTE